jgi:hypothetical protein
VGQPEYPTYDNDLRDTEKDCDCGFT